MKPRGPLMVEHRLIEKMLAVATTERGVMLERCEANPVFIDALVDFVRVYADRTHHGKEEAILFRDLATKAMTDEHRRLMAELLAEHQYARRTVAELVQAKQEYLQGHREALETTLDKLQALADFYPEHIRKEDQVFFPNTERYLTPEEQSAMLQEFCEFDRTMIHEKYRSLVDQLRRDLVASQPGGPPSLG